MADGGLIGPVTGRPALSRNKVPSCHGALGASELAGRKCNSHFFSWRTWGISLMGLHARDLVSTWWLERRVHVSSLLHWKSLLLSMLYSSLFKFAGGRIVFFDSSSKLVKSHNCTPSWNIFLLDWSHPTSNPPVLFDWPLVQWEELTDYDKLLALRASLEKWADYGSEQSHHLPPQKTGHEDFTRGRG